MRTNQVTAVDAESFAVTEMVRYTRRHAAVWQRGSVNADLRDALKRAAHYEIVGGITTFWAFQAAS